MGMILPGLTGIVLTTGALFIPGLSYELTMLLLLPLGICAGFFVVPVNALIQYRPQPAEKGQVIGVSNLLSFGGIAFCTVCHVEAGTSRRESWILDLFHRVHFDGFCSRLDVAAALAQRPLLDAAATTNYPIGERPRGAFGRRRRGQDK
jgi:hypothetical protein